MISYYYMEHFTQFAMSYDKSKIRCSEILKIQWLIFIFIFPFCIKQLEQLTGLQSSMPKHGINIPDMNFFTESYRLRLNIQVSVDKSVII